MKSPPFMGKIEERQTAIKWIKEFQKHSGETFCTICEQFCCDCGSSDCYKIQHSKAVITFLRYAFNIRVDEVKEE